MENITDADYIHEKKVCKHFKRNNIGKYCDLYVQSDTLLTADTLLTSLKISKFDSSCFLTFPWLWSQQAEKSPKQN